MLTAIICCISGNRKRTDFFIHNIRKSERTQLKKFTCLAIYLPNGVKKPDESILKRPELKLYYQDFGTKKGDLCLVAETDQKIVGAVWSMVIDDFAHLDDNTPSLAISVAEKHREKGIGTRLLAEMVTELKNERFPSVSLSVQKENFAAKMYKRAGFEVVKDNDGELIMIKRIHIKKNERL